MPNKKLKKHTLLKGEGSNQHTLYGNFTMDTDVLEFSNIKVTSDSILKHEKPNGEFSNEHKALQVDKGNWVMGKQVEYNPFKRSVSQVWD
jgi:hypothetical protein